MTLDADIVAHAQAAAPGESCGLVVATASGERYYPAQNIALAADQFEIDPRDWIAAELAGDIIAVVHSHPVGPAVLSAGDRLGQQATQLPWWLVVGEHIHRFRPVPLLRGRAFDHGREDCYSLIRDAYHLSGIELTDYERRDDWWDTDANLYLRNIEREGFKRLGPVAPPQLGDVILMQLGSSTVCHGAIYLGDGNILHHSPRHLSRRQLYSHSWQLITHSIWRHQQWQQCDFTAILNDLAASSA